MLVQPLIYLKYGEKKSQPPHSKADITMIGCSSSIIECLAQ